MGEDMATGSDGHDPESGLVWRYRPAPAGGSDCLAVVYSQVRVPEGRFGLERLFANTRHACLFLNCPDPVWYLGCEAAIDRAIDVAAKASGAARIVHYGASKGAYGALVAALRRGDGRAFAFGPELVLGRPGSQSGAVRSPAMANAPDMAEQLQRAGAGPEMTLVFGIFDATDTAGAVALSSRDLPERVRVLTLVSSHASHDHLYTLNIARKLITGFSRDLGALCAERGLIADDETADLERFARFFEGMAGAAEGSDGAGLANAVASALSDPYARLNPGYGLALGQALVRLGRRAEAAERLGEVEARIEAMPGANALPKRWRKAVWRARLSASEGTAAHGPLLAEAQARFPGESFGGSGPA
ncbi:hypothetical protein [Stappia indica]|uniref:hypothetical protein n=1 Tax=Stappia indica TaxID=538381 RepID=UPI00082BF80F|nr:hypothetical protein [Stappia indica]